MSNAEFCKQSGINIAYVFYILKRNHKIVSDNVIRNIASEFEITSLMPLFDPFKESEDIARSDQGLQNITKFKIIRGYTLLKWTKLYDEHRKRIFDKIILNYKPQELFIFEKSKEILEQIGIPVDIESPKPDSISQRKFNFEEAARIVEERKQIEKSKTEKLVYDRYAVLLPLLHEEEKNLEDKLVHVRALI